VSKIESSESRDRRGFLDSRSDRFIDGAFLAFIVVLTIRYLAFISKMHVPMWDACVYLTNARNWMTGVPLFEIYRPPLLSWIITAVWLFTGENWEIVMPLAALFSIGSGIILYLTLRPRKGSLFALGVTVLTMLNPQVFFYSSQIYTEGISLFFLIATLFFLKSQSETHWFLGGIMTGLAFSSRYPAIVQCGAILAAEFLVRRRLKLLVRAMMGALPTILIVVAAVYLKTGRFQTALPKDVVFSLLPSPYYLVNSVAIWGFAFILIPIAFIFRRTYSDSYNHAFIAWFVAGMLFWSMNVSNQQYRFSVGFTPAVSYIVYLAIENLMKFKTRSDLVFAHQNP